MLLHTKRKMNMIQNETDYFLDFIVNFMTIIY